jgi:hypothetical protein
MTAIHVPGLHTFTIAILVVFAGAGLNRVVKPGLRLLHRHCERGGDRAR